MPTDKTLDGNLIVKISGRVFPREGKFQCKNAIVTEKLILRISMVLTIVVYCESVWSFHLVLSWNSNIKPADWYEWSARHTITKIVS